MMDPETINLADVLETIAMVQPQAEVLVEGERRIRWGEWQQRTTSIARALVDLGLGRQAKVAQYLYNCPQYLESLVAAWKAGLVPVNTNYRYLDRELRYLWDNADVEAVIFHGCFAERIAGLRGKLPRIRSWLWVEDGSDSCPDWAIPYESTTADDAPLSLPWRRTGDDLLLIYTGGTTGMPKGVMWRQADLFEIVNRDRQPRPYDLSRGLESLARDVRQQGPGPMMLPACPQMHALGQLGSVRVLLAGGCVVTAEGRHFDPIETWELVERERVELLYIVGDAFARPLLEALDASPGRWDLSSLKIMRSSGVMWSQGVKEGLLRHRPEMILRDGLGSTESVGMGRSDATGSTVSSTASFEMGTRTRVLDDDLRPVVPGSGVRGRIAVGGPNPIGYYKDPEKSATTFPVIDGERFSVAGDYATVEADGRIRLLGRGSVTINTGGEKVFPEEVEEVLKVLPGIRDAVCVGVPDTRLGERVTAVVECVDGSSIDEDEVVAAVKKELAHYKAPRRVFVVDSIGRAANGKVDYRRWRQLAIARSAAVEEEAPS